MNKMRVGIVGLGIMGSAYARNLVEAGFEVSGFDISNDRNSALEDCGGFALSNARKVAERSDIVLIALASVEALDACTGGKDGLGDADLADIIICEMGTFSLEQKIQLRDQLEPRGAKVLDCPVSGTGAQAAAGDLSIYVSGEEKIAQKAQSVFEALARDVRYVGTYGTGIKLKLIANLLVTIHNLATAEALMLAKQSDLDLQMVYDAITHGAGTSRMFEVRGQMMIDENYQPATMKHDIYAKDLQLIIDYARQLNSPAPLMAASLPFYSAALAQGRGKEDTASLYGVLKVLADKAN